MAGYYELKTSASGQYMFNLRAGNHEVILTSESYSRKASAEAGIESVRSNSQNDAHYEKRKASDGSDYFVLKAGNGEVIGRSEMYSSRQAMEHGIASVKTNGPSPEVKER